MTIELLSIIAVYYIVITPVASVAGREATFGWLLLLQGGQMKTIVYIDGFNLYYGAVRKTPYKWLDLQKLCSHLLAKHDIQQIKYFTALVTARSDNPSQLINQQMYIRALRTLPNVEVIYGHFLVHNVYMPLADSGTPPKMVRVIKTEEKGSDVNLATHLLHDAHLNQYEAAVVISNDSDLLEPIRIVCQYHKKTIGILNPQKKASRVLAAQADFIKQIRSGVLSLSQFPTTLTDQNGTFHKPPAW